MARRDQLVFQRSVCMLSRCPLGKLKVACAVLLNAISPI
jgi:hypothetical protein